MNGKGDKPRNCFSKQFKNNFDEINWTPKWRRIVVGPLRMGKLPKNHKFVIPTILQFKPGGKLGYYPKVASKDLTTCELGATIVKHRKVKAQQHP